MTVQSFMKIVRIVFEKFEIFMKTSGEKKTKKRHDCISSRKFFPTPKNSVSLLGEISQDYKTASAISLKDENISASSPSRSLCFHTHVSQIRKLRNHR